MSSVSCRDLIGEVKETTLKVLNIADSEFKNASADELRRSPGENRWNALQCFEHLNIFGHFYIPEIEKQINQAKSKGSKPISDFSPGWLGNLGYKAMKLDPETLEPLKKSKTFKAYDPTGAQITEKSLTEMIDQQHKWLELVKMSEEVSLDIRIQTTLPLVKLKLGDTLRFITAHTFRHTAQAQRAMKGL